MEYDGRVRGHYQQKSIGVFPLRHRSEHGRARRRYARTFALFSSKVEKALVGAAVVLLAALVLAQLLLQNPKIRYLLVEVERMEGIPYARSAGE